MRLPLKQQIHSIERAKEKYLSGISREIEKVNAEIAIQAAEAEISDLKKSIDTSAPAEIAKLNRKMRLLKNNSGLDAPLFDFFLLRESIGQIHPPADDEAFDLVKYKTQLILLENRLSALSIYEYPLSTTDVLLELWRITGHDVTLHQSPDAYFNEMDAILQFRENPSDSLNVKKILKLIQFFPDINFESMRTALEATLQSPQAPIPSIDVSTIDGCYTLLTQVCSIVDQGENASILVNHVINNGNSLVKAIVDYAKPTVIAITKAMLSDNLAVDALDQNTLFLVKLALENFSLAHLKKALLTHIQKECDYYKALQACTLTDEAKEKITRLNAIRLAAKSITLDFHLSDATKNREMLMQLALYYSNSDAIWARSSSTASIIFSQSTPQTFDDAQSNLRKITKGFHTDTGRVEALLSQQSQTPIQQAAITTTENGSVQRQTLFQMRRSAPIKNDAQHSSDEEQRTESNTQPYSGMAVTL